MAKGIVQEGWFSTRKPPFCVNNFGWDSTPKLRSEVVTRPQPIREQHCPDHGDCMSDRYRIQSELIRHNANTNWGQDSWEGHADSYPLSITLRGWKLGWLPAILHHKERGTSLRISLPRGSRTDGERNLSWCWSWSLCIKLHLKLVLLLDFSFLN